MILDGYQMLAQQYKEKMPRLQLQDGRIVYFGEFVFAENQYFLMMLTHAGASLPEPLLIAWIKFFQFQLIELALRLGKTQLCDPSVITTTQTMVQDLVKLESQYSPLGSDSNTPPVALDPLKPQLTQGGIVGDIDAFFIAFDSGLTLYEYIPASLSGTTITDQLIPSLLAAFRGITKEILTDDLRVIAFSKRQIVVRSIKISEKLILMFILVCSETVPQQDTTIFLETITRLFISVFRDNLEDLEHQVIKTENFQNFSIFLRTLLRSTRKEIAANYPVIDSPQGRLQSLIDALLQHIPYKFIRVDSALIFLSPVKLIVPVDLSLEKTAQIRGQIYNVVAENFGKKIFEMAEKKAEKQISEKLQTVKQSLQVSSKLESLF